MANNNNDLFSMSPMFDALEPTSLESAAGKKPTTTSSKTDLQFPTDYISSFLKEGKYAEHVGVRAPVFLAAVLEYLTTEVLGLAGDIARDDNKTRIVPKHIFLAARDDEELSKLFQRPPESPWSDE